MSSTIDEITSGATTEAQTGAFLSCLQFKGVTFEEF